MGPRHTVASRVLTRSGAAITVAMCYHVFRLSRLCTALQQISSLHFWQTALVQRIWDRYLHFVITVSASVSSSPLCSMSSSQTPPGSRLSSTAMARPGPEVVGPRPGGPAGDWMCKVRVDFTSRNKEKWSLEPVRAGICSTTGSTWPKTSTYPAPRQQQASSHH